MKAQEYFFNFRGKWLLLLVFGVIFIAGKLLIERHHVVTTTKTLLVGIPGYWGTVVPPLQHSAYGSAVLDNQFEPLVRRGQNGLIEPLAAISWEVSPDNCVFRFKIDTKRRFSDGSSLSATDFKRSWENGLRMQAKSNNKAVEDALYTVKGFAAFAEKGTIEGVRVHGHDLLEIEFDKPVRVALEYLAGVRYAAYKFVGNRPIGTGPYVMEEKDNELFLTPNTYYTGNEPRFDKIKIVVAAPETVEKKLQSEEIDVLIFAERTHMPGCLDESAGKIRCAFSQEASHVSIDINGLRGRIFSNRKYRLALQALVHKKLEEIGLPKELQAGHFTSDSQSFLKFQSGRLSDTEVGEIIRLGRKYIPELVEASLRTPVYLVSADECRWLITILHDEGVKIAENSGRTEFSKMLEMEYKTYEPDIILGSFSVYNGDPDGLYHLLGKHGSIFSPMMDREGIGDLLDAGREIMDRNSLAPHYEKLARVILKEVPYVHLGYTARVIAYNSDKIRVNDNFISRDYRRLTILEPR
ncbi:MAG: hypothetical protein HY552_07075 [Elusimicrobia bacterium]|nr:hypothetical protein [Elusimicrobiota bacterium]